METVVIRRLPLPAHVRGFVLIDPDHCYNVYINSDLADEVAAKVAEHELRHAAENHLFSTARVAELEACADAGGLLPRALDWVIFD